MRTLLTRRGYAPSGVVHDLDAGDPELFFVRRYDGEAAEAFSAFHTARLLLRPAAPGDRDHLIALERDPEVTRFINGGRPTPADGRDPAAGFLTPRGGRTRRLDRHHASGRVMEKAGLSHVRTVYADWPDPLPGSKLGDVEYELTRDVWEGGDANSG